jgi:NADPH-dependent 2,4-dienoyl-CoA reductase/sulfur reductase-like enzyme
VGGGFVGLEVAENLLHRGMQVAVVEALPQPAQVACRTGGT